MKKGSKRTVVKAKKKPLQKFTDLEKGTAMLFAKKKILREDVFSIFPDAKTRQEFANICQDKLNSTDGTDRDDLIEQISDFIPVDVKNQLWEHNHTAITIAITKLMSDFGRMPSKQAIAVETKLSRQTIHNHLKEYSTHPCYSEEKRKFKFLTDRVLGKVFQKTIEGDVKAMRLFLEVMGCLPGQSPLIKNQNNYIQINGTIINQAMLQSLKPEQVKQIEDIVRTITPLHTHELITENKN